MITKRQAEKLPEADQMSLITKSAIYVLGKRSSSLLETATQNPSAVQRRLLLEIVRRNASTAFGRDHNLARINSEGDYRKQVPIRDFEGLRPYIQRIMAGEQAVLTSSDPFLFTVTSGTTGEPKYIPVTKVSRAGEASLVRQWFYRTLADNPEFMDYAGVGIVSRAIEGLTASGIPYGSASGLTYKNLPFLIRRTQAIPYPTFEITDYDKRYFVMARFALARNVSFIATPNPSTLLRLARVANDNSEKLVQAVHDGTLGIEMAVAQRDLLAHLSQRLQPDRERARELEAVVKKTGMLRPANCWPGLKVIGCWIGGSAGLLAERLGEYYGSVPVRDLGYKASEGHFSMPVTNGVADGILALRNNYYEFIPEAEANSQQPIVLTAAELELNGRYSVVVTTAGGLFRYRINDIVEVTGFRNQTPLIAFLRKEGEMTNITGEKLHVNHLLTAFAQVRTQLGFTLDLVRVSPDYEQCRYELFILPGSHVSHEVLRQRVLPEIDCSLARANIEYAQKRLSGRLGAPCLHLMAPGWAEESHRQHHGSPARDVQFKWPVLSSNRRPEDTAHIVATIEIDTLQEAGKDFTAGYIVA